MFIVVNGPVVPSSGWYAFKATRSEGSIRTGSKSGHDLLCRQGGTRGQGAHQALEKRVIISWLVVAEGWEGGAGAWLVVAEGWEGGAGAWVTNMLGGRGDGKQDPCFNPNCAFCIE